MEIFTPFGYRYEGTDCIIKLRFTKEKFTKSGLDKYRHYRETYSGYIIFEIRVNTKSEEYKEISEMIYNSAR
jgi:hypothetical protein